VPQRELQDWLDSGKQFPPYPESLKEMDAIKISFEL